MNDQLLPRPITACAAKEGVLLTFSMPGGLELSVWCKPVKTGAVLNDAQGERVVHITGDPWDLLALLPAH